MAIQIAPYPHIAIATAIATAASIAIAITTALHKSFTQGKAGKVIFLHFTF